MSTYDVESPQPARRSARKGCLIGCIAPLLYLAVLNLLPFFYTPPALTTSKRETYLRVVEFITAIKKKHNLEDAMLDRFDTIDVFRHNRWIDRNSILSPSELEQGLRLCAELKAAHCRHARSEGKMILFYPMVSHFMPHPPGVLYSVDGQDPNHTGGSRIARLRPFEKMGGNWYSSMKMRPRRFSGW